MSRQSFIPIEIEESDNELLTFGKHKGKWLAEVGRDDPSYLGWLALSGKTFAPTVMNSIRKFLARYPRQARSSVESIRKKGGTPTLAFLEGVEVDNEPIDRSEPHVMSPVTKPSAATSELWGMW